MCFVFFFLVDASITGPFVDVRALAQVFEQQTSNGSLLSFMDVFTGGGLSNATIFAMGITPYINASIILQLLTVAIPALEHMVKDGGEEGQKKIASWTRYVAVLLGFVQGFSYYMLLKSWGMLTEPGVWAASVILSALTAGSGLMMWMGDHIPQNG